MMARVCIRIFLVLGLLVPLAPLHADDAEDRHVLLISIDGFPAYMFDDPAASIPNLRQLASEGAVAKRGMRITNPSVTWPTHTSMVTGTHPATHSVVYNGMAVRGGPGQPVSVDPHRDKAELVAVPTLYDVAYEAGLSTAEVNWPCTRNAGTLDHAFPDTPDHFKHATPQLAEEMIELGLMEPGQESWDWGTTSPASRDDVYTRVLKHIIREHQPNVMLFHLLDVDAVHHRYSAQSWASYSAVANADNNVGRVLQALEEAGIRDRTTVFVVADHGFKTAQQTVHPNVMLREAGLIEVEGGSIASARAHAVSIGGGAQVYLTDPDTREQDKQTVIELFENAEGIATVLTADQFAEHHLPHPDEHEGVGDLFIEAADGYGFTAGATGGNAVTQNPGPRGHHGYLAQREQMNSLFIASGPGIVPGAEIEEASIIDVAPTLARLLDLELPTAEGAPIDAILQNTP